jgi:hypothetical protein
VGDPACSDQRRNIGEENNPPAALGSAPIIETDFAELEDGCLAEMIENPKDPADTLFVVYKNGTISYATTVQGKNHMLAPLRRQDQILKHMHFPRGVIPHESLKTLLARIHGVILHCADLEESDARLVSLFVLSTWFIERLCVAPYLAIVGPPRSGKTTLLELLTTLCRHALLTADISSAALYDLYNKLTPTVLVDETLTAPDKRAPFHLLRAGTTRGSVAFRKGRSLKAFGPKVVSWTAIPTDAALVSRCIIIPMMESSRTDLKKLTDNRVSEATTSLRMALLDYRLKNLKSLRLPKIDGDECLYSRTRDLYQALALPVGSNETICKFLVLGFKRQHEIGRALSSLGFADRKRMSAGYILWLDLRTRKRIHKLAHDIGIDQEEWFKGKGFASHCDLCKNPGTTNPASAETKEVSGAESKKL